VLDCREKRAFVVVLSATMLTACGSTTSPVMTSTTTTTVVATAPSASQTNSPSAESAAPRSKLLDVTFPSRSVLKSSGPIRDGRKGQNEFWAVPGEEADVARELGSQLPLGQDFDGYPWCRGGIESGMRLWAWVKPSGQEIRILTFDAKDGWSTSVLLQKAESPANGFPSDEKCEGN
jgi:hypothetical protein